MPRYSNYYKMRMLSELFAEPEKPSKEETVKEKEADLKLGIMGGRTLAPAESTYARERGLLPALEKPEEPVSDTEKAREEAEDRYARRKAEIGLEASYGRTLAPAESTLARQEGMLPKYEKEKAGTEKEAREKETEKKDKVEVAKRAKYEQALKGETSLREKMAGLNNDFEEEELVMTDIEFDELQKGLQKQLDNYIKTIVKYEKSEIEKQYPAKINKDKIYKDPGTGAEYWSNGKTWVKIKRVGE